jgi:hypothetical protein
MVFREGNPPALSLEEREGLARICEATCAWIDGAARSKGAPVKVSFMLFQGYEDERRAVIEACAATGDDLRALEH